MQEKEKSPMELALDAAFNAEMEKLRKGYESVSEEPEPKKKKRPDFHGLKAIRGGKK
jgi:hypothetical protein